MMKRFLLILILILFLPAFAGEYEDALQKYDKIFLYFYTQECSYCKKFEPIFEKISKLYGEKCKFVKVDANSNYGSKLSRSFYLKFVPYVVLVESKKERGLVISPNCLLEYACTGRVVEDFIK